MICIIYLSSPPFVVLLVFLAMLVLVFLLRLLVTLIRVEMRAAFLFKGMVTCKKILFLKFIFGFHWYSIGHNKVPVP